MASRDKSGFIHLILYLPVLPEGSGKKEANSAVGKPPVNPCCSSAFLGQVLENYNKGKTALLSAAKVMVSPTEVDLTPELIFQSQPLPSCPSVQIGTGAIPADRRNSSTK